MLLILALLISLSLAVTSSDVMKIWELEMARHWNIDLLTRDSQPLDLIFVQNIFKRWKSHRLMFSDVSFNEDDFVNDIYLALRPKEGSNRNQWSYEILSMILSYHQNNHLGVLQSYYRPSVISSKFETLESFIEGYLKIVYKDNIALLLRDDFFLCKLKPSVLNDLVDFMKINVGDKVEQLRIWIMLAQTSEEALCAHVNIQFQEGGCLTYIAQRANDHDVKSVQIIFYLMLSAAVINGVAENLDVLYHQNHKPGTGTVLNGRTFNIKNILPSKPVNLVPLPEFPPIQAFCLPEDVVQYYTQQAEKLLQKEFYNGADLGGSPSLKQVQQIIDRWHPRTSVSYIHVASREAFLKIFKLMMQTKNTIGYDAIEEEKWFQTLALCLNGNDDRIIRKFFGNTNITVNTYVYDNAAAQANSEIILLLASPTLVTDLENLLRLTDFKDFCKYSFFIPRQGLNCLNDVVAILREEDGAHVVLSPEVTMEHAMTFYVDQIYNALVVKNVINLRVPSYTGSALTP